MNKEIIVIGDIEMGGGTITDDFISDNALSKLLLSLAKKRNPVDLILNGDTFDFLKCPIIIKGKVKYPRHITEEVSFYKLHLIYDAHKKVFEAMRRFVQQKHHRLYFIIGNHDYDLLFKGVQQEIKRLLQGKGNILFALKYEQHGVYAEHGMQYDILHKMNLTNIFLRFKGKSVLNMPWISLGTISLYLPRRKEHPFMERVMPRPALIRNHKVLEGKLRKSILPYFLKSVFYYPFKYHKDPTYKFPRALVSELSARIKKAHYDVDGVVDKFKRRKRKKLRKNKIYVLGHVHKRYIEEKGSWVIIHPDTWRDEYNLDQKTKKLIPKGKRYVHITVTENGPSWRVVDVPVKRSVWPFADVVEDEMKYLKLAAAEEGYSIKFTT